MRGAPTAARPGPLSSVLLVLVGLLVATAAGYLQSMPRQFESSAVVSLQPRADDAIPSASMIELLASPYVAHATADSTLAQVARSTGLDRDEVASGVTVSLPAGSTTVTVDAAFSDPDRSREVAGEVARRIAAFAAGDRTLAASVVIPPTDADRTTLTVVKPVLVPLLGVGALVLIALGVWRLLRSRSRRQGAGTR